MAGGRKGRSDTELILRTKGKGWRTLEQEKGATGRDKTQQQPGDGGTEPSAGRGEGVGGSAAPGNWWPRGNVVHPQ